jgi:hypothetical protein
MPTFEVASQLLTEHAGSHLEQPMCTGHRPSHLLFLDEPLADYLVDGWLDKSSRNRLAVPVPVGVVRNSLQPAIRRTLLTLRAFVEGERALGYWCAHLLDIAEHHPDFKRRADAHDQVSVLTPIVKSLFTENGFSLSSAALQVWGGYGYIHDYGIE